MMTDERNTIPTSYNALISKFRAKCAQVEALKAQWAGVPWGSFDTILADHPVEYDILRVWFEANAPQELAPFGTWLSANAPKPEEEG